MCVMFHIREYADINRSYIDVANSHFLRYLIAFFLHCLKYYIVLHVYVRSVT